MNGRSLFEEADDGTQPEDLAIYLADLDRYREWFMRESPAEYLGRLERVLGLFDGHLAALDRLTAIPEEDFLADEDYASSALWQISRAVVGLLEVSKWLLARETPKGYRPRSFSEAFAWLVEQGVLPTEKLADYRALCRLRNWFAHNMDETLTAAEARAWVVRWLPELRAVAAHLRARYL